MAKGPLRIALDDFFTTNPLGVWIRNAVAGYRTRLAEVVDTFTNMPVTRIGFALVMVVPILLATVIFLFTGWRWPFDGFVKLTIGIETPNTSSLISEFLRKASSDPAIAEIAEVMGAIWVDPFLGVLEQGAGQDETDPMEIARRFMGVATRLSSISEAADLALEMLSAGQIESKGRGNASLNAMIGISTVAGEIFRPIMNSAIQPGMERYYRRLYRPNRFSAGELRDLYALHRISLADLKTEAATLGWRDVDIEQWIALAFRNVSESDIWALYQSGDLTADQVTVRLSSLGYSATDIPLLFKANPKKDVKDTPEVTRTTARAAFRDGLLSEAELKAALVALDLSVREADLIVAIERRNVEEAVQRLSVGQIKAAWEENVLSDTEARHWLGQANIPVEQVSILLATWRAGMEPAFRKLNRGTIIGAYVAGILNRTQAQAKLQTVGYLLDDAKLELDLAEVQNPQAFGRPTAKPSRLLTPGNLTDLVVAGLINPVDMQARLITAGYTESDAQLLGELARLQAAGIGRQLSQSTVERAYISHVLTRDLAELRLRDLGLADQDATIVLNTVEREHPAEFGPTEDATPRQLPLGVIAAAVLSGLLSNEEYQARAVELGYAADDAALVLAVARQEQATRPRQAGQGTIERAYILQVLDRAQAAAKLAEIGFQPADLETILQSVERDNPAVFAPDTVQAVRQPGPGALVEAQRNGIITSQEYFARMLEIGYNQSAAEIYLSLATVAERKSLKRLSDAKVLELYTKQIFTRGETEARLTQNGYNQIDAGLLMRLERSGIEDTQTWSDFLAGVITVGDMIQQLFNQGFTSAEIDDAIAKIS